MVVVVLVVLVVVVVGDSVAQRLGLGLRLLGAIHDPRHDRGRDRGFARSWKSVLDTILVVVIVSVVVVSVIEVMMIMMMMMMMMMMMVVMEVVVEMVVMVVTVLVVVLVPRRASIAKCWTRIPSTTTAIDGWRWLEPASFQSDASGARLERAKYRFARQRVVQSQLSSRRKRHDWTTNGRWWSWAGDVIQFANGYKREQSRNSGPRLGQWSATARPMYLVQRVEWSIPWSARATRRKTMMMTTTTTTKRNEVSCEKWLGLEWWWLRPWLWPSALIVPGGESLYDAVVYIDRHNNNNQKPEKKKKKKMLVLEHRRRRPTFGLCHRRPRPLAVARLALTQFRRPND